MAGIGSSSGRPCHYAVLGVARDASAAEIRAAYRQLALRWHPDKVQLQGEDPREKEEADTRFLQIRQAYDVLSDDSRRAAYDAVAFWPRATCACARANASAFTPRDDDTRAREIQMKMATAVAKMKESAERLKQVTEHTWAMWEQYQKATMSSRSGAGASGATAANPQLQAAAARRAGGKQTPASSASSSTSHRYSPFNRKG
ncbi:unnamed protein product [Urochloa humidicola]